jgi:hypothetical protein
VAEIGIPTLLPNAYCLNDTKAVCTRWVRIQINLYSATASQVGWMYRKKRRKKVIWKLSHKVLIAASTQISSLLHLPFFKTFFLIAAFTTVSRTPYCVTPDLVHTKHTTCAETHTVSVATCPIPKCGVLPLPKTQAAGS